MSLGNRAKAADGAGDPVDHHVREQLVLGEAQLDVTVAVAPGAELVHQPGRPKIVERVLWDFDYEGLRAHGHLPHGFGGKKSKTCAALRRR